jgi:hypothetical protein
MEIKREKLRDLMQNYCYGNYNRFGRELGIDPSHLYRFLNTGVGGGKKLVGAVMKFCKENELNFEDYIDL